MYLRETPSKCKRIQMLIKCLLLFLFYPFNIFLIGALSSYILNRVNAYFFFAVVLENHEVTDDDVEPVLKRQRIEINCQDPSIKSFLYSINQTICLRLDSIEAKLLALEATCKSLEEKLDLVMNKQHSPIQVPMVAGSPLGATQTCNKVRW
uniref:Uncharacterized protein n=1 Tax=Accipiter nisus TaxID=211598 RepID=A0A8B9M9D8_9AVES